jgi:hypothetical protein
MMRMNTPLEIRVLLENKAAMMTVQITTEVINRRRNTFDFEGVWAATTALDMRAKVSRGIGYCQSPSEDPASGTEGTWEKKRGRTLLRPLMRT